MSDEAGVALVLCSAPPGDAERLSRLLLERRLAACVNILPAVVSLYWWEGAIERADESLMLIKTRSDRLDELTAALTAAHPYDVPEVLVIATMPEAGNPLYRAWVLAEALSS